MDRARLLLASLLTPAEKIAVYQVLSAGAQSIVLGANGNAVSGSFTLGADASQYISGLLIPAGVTGIKNFGNGSALNLSGNLINAGTLLAYSNNPALNTAAISANNITNLPGGLISSVLPSASIAGVSNPIANLHLQLSAVQNFVYYGTISSSGNLNISAGSSIINGLAQGGNAAQALMQALGNLNLQAAMNLGLLNAQTGTVSVLAAQLVNSGIIQALSGSVSIGSLGSSLAILNTNGSIIARDAIMISNSAPISSLLNAHATLDLNGGLFSASSLAISSPAGMINLNVDQILLSSALMQLL